MVLSYDSATNCYRHFKVSVIKRRNPRYFSIIVHTETRFSTFNDQYNDNQLNISNLILVQCRQIQMFYLITSLTT